MIHAGLLTVGGRTAVVPRFSLTLTTNIQQRLGGFKKTRLITISSIINNVLEGFGVEITINVSTVIPK